MPTASPRPTRRGGFVLGLDEASQSSAIETKLNVYIDRFDRSPEFSRLIFVCHSPGGIIAVLDRGDVTVWSGRPLAEAVMHDGPFDWSVARAA